MNKHGTPRICPPWPPAGAQGRPRAPYDPDCAVPAADAAVALVHHLPPRSGPPLRALDVRRVYRADDLPSYLLFGVRDDAGFRAGADGWSAIWRGTQPDTWLRGEYRRGSDTLRFTQRWCGIAAGEGMFPASVLPEEALGALYRQHLEALDQAALQRLMPRYRLVYHALPVQWQDLMFFPDGHFRCALVPLPAWAAAAFTADWPRRVAAARLPFPLQTHLLRLQLEIAYQRNAWAPDDAAAARLAEACRQYDGAAPTVAQVTLEDGQPALAITRRPLCAVVTVPFAGLPDALERLQEAGVLSHHDQAPLPPAAIEPLVLALEATFAWRVRVSLYSAALRVNWYVQPVSEAQRRAAPPSP